MTSTAPPLTPAGPGDEDEIAALVHRAYRDDSAGGWTSEAHLLDDERIDGRRVRDKLDRPDAVLLTARSDDGAIFACCEVVRVDGEAAYFGLFAVEPGRQGSGLGRAVLAAAEDLARTRWDATRMEMTVIGQRRDLIAWYERRGYQMTGERRPFPYDDLVNGSALRDDLYFAVLRKDLTSPP